MLQLVESRHVFRRVAHKAAAPLFTKLANMLRPIEF